MAKQIRLKQSQKPHKVLTASIGEIIQAQAKYGNPNAQKSAKKFLKINNNKRRYK